MVRPQHTVMVSVKYGIFEDLGTMEILMLKTSGVLEKQPCVIQQLRYRKFFVDSVVAYMPFGNGTYTNIYRDYLE